MSLTDVAQTPTLTGTWTADAVHSELAFKVRHMGVGKAGGTLALTAAALTFGEHGIADGSVTATVDATSIETKNDQRNAHVRSDDFLDAENNPTIEFRSTGVRDLDGEEFDLGGDLTIRGVTKPVTLRAELLGAAVDASGTDRVGFSADGKINRKDFGVKFDAAFGTGNAVVSDKVDLHIEVEFVRADD